MADYLYNGIRLPQLPEWDRETYPLCIITRSDTNTYLLCYVSTKKGVLKTGVPNFRGDISFKLIDGAWVQVDDGNVESGTIAIWANYDLMYWVEDDEYALYLAASDPIPVTEPTDPFALLMGFRVGQLIKGMRGKITEQPDSGETEEPEQTPIAYLYNDVQLPALPEYDKETYLYAYITTSTAGYGYLALSTCEMQHSTYIGYSRFWATADCSVVRYSKPVDAEEWFALDNKTLANGAYYGLAGQKLLWANFDVKAVDDGTLYLAASDPIPVYE